MVNADSAAAPPDVPWLSARLSRRVVADRGQPRPAAPVRIVHLGLGAFHRAHQAWYTAHAADATEWGIAAFTGRSPATANRLAAQDGLYTLIERGPTGDAFELVGSIVRAMPGSRVDELARLVGDPRIAIATLTITEAGYRLAPDGSPELSDSAVRTDVESLRTLSSGAPLAAVAPPTTALGRLLAGLEFRRRARAAPLAIVPCDNLPRNGELVQAALSTLADMASPRLAAWLVDGVSVVSTSVDRITPRTAAADEAAVRDATGVLDAAPVVTEPFSDWVLCGEFPSGRPAWDSAGARFVTDVTAFEKRKLWLLNGAHTLLSFLGPLRGHTTVAGAIDDRGCRVAVERLWDEAARGLSGDELDISAYRAALLDRFRNPRIDHRLRQIAMDGLTKLRLRILPVARAELAARGSAPGCATAVAAWIAAVRTDRVADDALSGAADDVAKAIADPLPERALLRVVDADLASDDRFWTDVETALRIVEGPQ